MQGELQPLLCSTGRSSFQTHPHLRSLLAVDQSPQLHHHMDLSTRLFTKWQLASARWREKERAKIKATVFL